MRRILIAAAFLAASVPGAADAHSAHPAIAGDAYLRGFACHRSLDPSKRVVTVTAVMGTVPGTAHLQMRFVLLERTARGVGFVRGGDLGRWISPSSPTLGQHPSDQWVVNHPVTGVPVPASYRFRVSFRWIASSGRAIAQTQRTSALCRQPDMRPDLYVQLVSLATVAGGEQYTVEVGNSGLTSARNVEVQFAPGGGASPQTATIPRLRPGASVDETFTGPACTPNSSATITVDPSDLIDVASRADNSITVPCPSG
jgi:hypothetical protein